MLIKLLTKLAIRVTQKRAPDFIIGDPKEPYMLRWWWLPRNHYFNIYIHRFLKDDDDEAFHDHPWPSYSIMCEGDIYEHYKIDIEGFGSYNEWRRLKPGDKVYRPAKFAHRIVVLPSAKLPLTIFITGPRVREWGFYCPKGWRHWKDFLASLPNNSHMRRGCGDMDLINDTYTLHCKECGDEYQSLEQYRNLCSKCNDKGLTK